MSRLQTTRELPAIALPAVVGEHLSRNPQLQQLSEQNCHEIPQAPSVGDILQAHRDACALRSNQ